MTCLSEILPTPSAIVICVVTVLLVANAIGLLFHQGWRESNASLVLEAWLIIALFVAMYVFAIVDVIDCHSNGGRLAASIFAGLSGASVFLFIFCNVHISSEPQQQAYKPVEQPPSPKQRSPTDSLRQEY